jgi:T5SS/PEP-CTERM-associated repeat protein
MYSASIGIGAIFPASNHFSVINLAVMKHHTSHNECSIGSLFTATLLFASLLTPSQLRADVLESTDGAAGDVFGYAVSASGANALVSAYKNDNTYGTDAGAAYYYKAPNGKPGGLATQSVRLTSTEGFAGNHLGMSVSLNGDNALVATPDNDSARGAAYYYKNLDSNATGTAMWDVKLTASDAASSDQLGKSASLYGDNALVGARYHYTTDVHEGAAYYFKNLNSNTTGTATQDVKLIASDAAFNDSFGDGVSLSGDSALAGAKSDDDWGSESGSAYYFKNLNSNTSGVATENVKLTASDGAANDFFGNYVSLSGDKALVSSYRATVNGHTVQGAAYYFKGLNSNTTGHATENVKLTASDGAANDTFGVSVSLNGDTALLGANGDDNMGSASGSAYIFTALDSAGSAATETLILTASDGLAGDNFGVAVSLSGDNFVIGAHKGDSTTTSTADTGKAYTGSVSSMTTLDAGSASRTIRHLSFTSYADWVIGLATDNNSVTLYSGDTATVTASGKAVYIGKAAGSDNNTLTIYGTLTTNAVYVGSVTGNSGNTLVIGGGASVANNVTLAVGNSLSVFGDYRANVSGLLALFASVKVYNEPTGASTTTLAADNYTKFAMLGYDAGTGFTTLTAAKYTVASVSSATAKEGSPFVHTVTLNNETDATIQLTLKLGATGDTAWPGNDFSTSMTFSNGVTYDSGTGKITIPSGVTTFTVTVSTVGDHVKESTETYTLTVGGISGTGTLDDIKGYTEDNPFEITSKNEYSYLVMSQGVSGTPFYYATGEDLFLGSYSLVLGDSTAGNYLTIGQSGILSTDASFTIGNRTGSSGFLTVSGGSILDVGGNLTVGGLGEGSMTVSGNALVAIGGTLSTGSNGTIYLAKDGYLALKGEHTAKDVLATLNLYVAEGSKWVKADVTNLSVVYFDETSGRYAKSYLQGILGDSIDLAGWTVVCYSGFDTSWSSSTSATDYWYASSWYGDFYYAPCMHSYIWHAAHGWQFVLASAGTSDIYVWDFATNSWMFTSNAFYPWMYQYRYDAATNTWGGSWCYYKDGIAPNREFYDMQTLRSVKESAIVQ